MGLISVYVALILAQIGFGGYNTVLSLYGNGTNTDPMVHILIRDSGACLILSIWTTFYEKGIVVPKTKREISVLALCGFLGFFIARTGFVWGVYFTNASIATIFQPITPVWVYVFAILTRIEAFPDITTIPGLTRVLGVLCAIGGAITMCVGKGVTGSYDKSSLKLGLGYFALVLNTSCNAMSFVLQKKFMFMDPKSRFKDKPFSAVVWMYAFSLVFNGIWNIYNAIEHPEKFTDLQPEAFYAIAYGCLVNSTIGFTIMTWATRITKTTLVSTFLTLQTLVGVLLPYFILGEKLNYIEIIGGVLILMALAAVLWASTKEEKQEASVRKENEASKDKEMKEDLVTAEENKKLLEAANV